MTFELLHAPPMSGTVLERHFEVSARKNEWVRFTDDDGAEWVGVFGSGEISGYSAVVPFADDNGRTVLVVAGGQGYVVDATSGSLLRRTPWDYAQQAMSVPGRDFVLVADTTELWAAGRQEDRLAWRREPGWYDANQTAPTHRVALDGIRFDAVTSNALTGRVWELDGWYAFRLGLPELEFIRGQYLGEAGETHGPIAPAG
jgi:hypothetical protein